MSQVITTTVKRICFWHYIVHQLLLINTTKLKVSVIFEAIILHKFNATNICIMEGHLCITNTESKGAYFENWGNINYPKPFLILMDFVHALLNGKKV